MVKIKVDPMKAAIEVSKKATCNRAHVGAVLVDRFGNIVSTGSNHQINGDPSCEDIGCLMVEGHCKRTIHAEVNAILKRPDTDEPLTLYVTHYPCPECMKVIRQAGIRDVHYIKSYDDYYDNTFAEGITFIQHAEEMEDNDN